MVAVLKSFAFLFVVVCLAAGLTGCKSDVPPIATQGATPSASSSGQGVPATAGPPTRKQELMRSHMNLELKTNTAAPLEAGSKIGH